MGLNRAKFHYDHYYPDMNLVLGPYVLWQAGDLRCEPGYMVDAHEQIVHEVSYIVSGQGTFVLNGVEYPVRKGDVFINKIADMHTVISSEYDPLRYYYMGFDFKPPIASEVTLRIKDFWEHTAVPILSGAVNIQEAFIDFLSEIEVDDFLATPLMECYVQRIICEVYRQFNRNQRSQYLLHEERSMDEKLIYDVVQYLETHMEQQQSLSALSEVFGYSYSHIASRFKAVIGEPLNAYCQRRRFERAQANMRRGMSITEVAEAAKYKSIHAFSRAYKHHFGVPPTKYKDALPAHTLSPDVTGRGDGAADPADRINVAVIGCGAIAHAAHIPQYLRHPNVNLLYLCDINPARSMDAVNRCRCGAAVTDYRVILRDPEIDAVSICTPSDHHAPIAIDFLNAGKAVLCEMPAARTLEGAEEMQRIMLQRKQVLLIGMDNRYESGVERIRRMILGGQLGEVYHVYIAFRSHRAIPGLGTARTTLALSGGGALIDKGMRHLDTALYCLGNPHPVTVSASTFCRLGRNIREYVYERMEGGPPKLDGVYDVEDSLTALIRTEGPALTLNGGWAQNIEAEETHIDFIGDKAGIRYTPGEGFMIYGAENGALISYTPAYAKQDPIGAEIDDFVARVLARDCPMAAMEQTVATMRVVQAVYASASRNREIAFKG